MADPASLRVYSEFPPLPRREFAILDSGHRAGIWPGPGTTGADAGAVSTGAEVPGIWAAVSGAAGAAGAVTALPSSTLPVLAGRALLKYAKASVLTKKM